jgi:transcriptional regulator with XRE-family HTH domain
MRNTSKSIPVDGEKIRDLRKEKFVTQQRFADKCGVSEKTIQRAEKGGSIDPDVVNEMAKALKVNIEDIVSEADGTGVSLEQAPPHYEYLRLKQPDSVKELFTAAKSDILEFEFDVDLDQNTANEIASFIEPIEEMNNRSVNVGNPPASEQLRIIGRLSEGLQTLTEKGICIFIGFTTFRENYTEEFPTEFDYEIYVNSIVDKTKAVVQFGNCDTKTVQVLTFVGHTYSEAREWLAKQQKNAASNVKTDWGDYPEIDWEDEDDTPFSLHVTSCILLLFR